MLKSKETDMGDTILEHFLPVTEEEKRILEDGNKIDPKIYADSDDFLNDINLIVGDDFPIHIRKHTRFTHFPAHRHNYIEIVYVYSGRNEQIIDGEHITLHSGELLFLPLGTVHEIMPAGYEDISINFLVRPEFFSGDIFMQSFCKNSGIGFITDILMSGNSGSSAKYSFFVYDVGGILPVRNLIENLIIDLIDADARSVEIRQATFALLLLELSDLTPTVSEGENRNGIDMVFQVIRYIDDEYASASLKEIASRLHCSIYYLSHAVRSSVGSTFSELLQKRRLACAERLLSYTDKSVESIISEVGYTADSYFYRAFRKVYGMTPLQYRKSKKKDDEKTSKLF